MLGIDDGKADAIDALDIVTDPVLAGAGLLGRLWERLLRAR
jgi:hypothetical protein